MSIDKLWADLGGEPLVAHSLRVFARSNRIHELVVVVAAGREAQMRSLLATLGVEARVVTGGAERQDSVRHGLASVGEAEWLVVHDAARPLLTEELIARGLEA